MINFNTASSWHKYTSGFNHNKISDFIVIYGLLSFIIVLLSVFSFILVSSWAPFPLCSHSETVVAGGWS